MYLHHRRTARRHLLTPADSNDEDANAYNSEEEISRSKIDFYHNLGVKPTEIYYNLGTPIFSIVR